MITTYQAPVSVWRTRADGERIAILPDGTRLTDAEWRKTRVTFEEYVALAKIRMAQRAEYRPIEPDPETPR
jgi:hypothetical protein